MPGRDPHPARRLVPVGDIGSGRDDGHASPAPSPSSPGSWSASICSWRSRASVLSAGSFASLLSAGSALSAGSFGSVGSVGSILSFGSSGSILSIGSTGSVLSIGAAGGFMQIGRRPAGSPARDLTSLVVPLAAAADAVLGRRLAGLLPSRPRGRGRASGWAARSRSSVTRLVRR
jgi:hypothetical protein